MNAQYCNKCYCYCCDKPVAECTEWKESHCNASDKGAESLKWKKIRDEVKRRNDPTYRSTVDDNDEDEDEDHGDDDGGYPGEFMFMDMVHDFFMNRMETSSQDEDSDGYGYHTHASRTAHRNAVNDGPYEPDKVKAGSGRARSLTQCRKCKWWSNHQNLTHVLNDKDWCHACGRVVSESLFGKRQANLFVPEKGDISLGTKEINFRIKARDPRKIQPFQKKWEELEGKQGGWVYNEKEMRYDFFRHRIGQRPEVSTLLHAIPVLAEDKIPDSGRTELTMIRHRHDNTDEVSGFETEALLLDDRNDKKLLEELHNFFALADPKLKGQINAKWNQRTQKGVSMK